MSEEQLPKPNNFRAVLQFETDPEWSAFTRAWNDLKESCDSQEVYQKPGISSVVDSVYRIIRGDQARYFKLTWVYWPGDIRNGELLPLTSYIAPIRADEIPLDEYLERLKSLTDSPFVNHRESWNE